MTSSFWRHGILMFLALRTGDLVNLAAGMWLVPKFVSPDDLGAVLPVSTFATLIVLPLFAFAMAVMKESADLAGHGQRGQLKSLWRGVFASIAVLTALSLAASIVLIPSYLDRMELSLPPSSRTPQLTTFFVLAAALLGSVAPVYTDALQAVKRFRALAAIEFSAAVARLATLAVLMPLRAFVGYFAGNAMQPLVRIAASVFALRHDLAVTAEPWWTRENTVTLFRRFALAAAYLVVPMAVAALEQDLVRTQLPSADSAGYYVMTRLSDLMNYLTLPLLIVLFPYAAEATRNGKSTLSLVTGASAVTLLAAVLLGVFYALFGASILALIPTGTTYSACLVHLPALLAITALTACQTFFTNAEVASGRFSFLWWFLPMNLAYALLLKCAVRGLSCLSDLLPLFLVGAILRFVCAFTAMARIETRKRRSEAHA